MRIRFAVAPDPDLLAECLPPDAQTLRWVDDVAAPADSPAALRYRERELSRTAAEFRAVLLRYADAQADLIIVADRCRYGVTTLRQVAAAAGASGAVSGGRYRPEPPLAMDAPPAWGLAGRGTGYASHRRIVPAVIAGDRQSWLAALAVTLDRYKGHGATGAVRIRTDDDVVEVTVGGTLDEMRLHRATPAAGTVSAVLSTEALAAPIGTEYLPFLPGSVPLVLTLARRADGGVEMRCDHDTQYVAEDMIGWFLTSLVQVHGAMVKASQTLAGEAQLLDSDGVAAVVALGRSERRLITDPAPLHEAFGRVAIAYGDAVAVCDGDRLLTYMEVQERSTRMASGLRSAGIRTGDRIGVCLEPTADLICTLLAVSMAGGAYVPMDPGYPAERRTFTVDDAGLGLVVTELVDFPAGVTAITPAVLAAAGAPEAPLPHVCPDSAAYVIYTSGSTGRPKGVIVAHRNVVSLVDAVREEYRLGASDVWTWFHSSAFDFSVWEIWGCLLTGGRLIVVPREVSREPEQFRDLLVAERVTVLSQTPSAFAQLLSVPHAAVVARLVVFGGEPLDTRMLLSWFDQHPETVCRTVNMFGITETTVHVTARTVYREMALAGSRSVGQSLPGWHVYVLDRAGLPAPPGVAGEICVGGAGVADGYLNQADLTEQRFVADPWGPGRIYRSGDLGRLLPDGDLEHLGRIDSQVKIRGFRIELDEIRSVLLEDRRVQAAAVVVRRSDNTDAATTRLDAYVVTDGSIWDIRRRAAAILPEYMVPATVTAVPALPLTGNGKLDISQLPDPLLPAAPAAPAEIDGDLLQSLRTVWSDVLGVPVGPDDDFFELGGNSLFAVRINAALRAIGIPTVPLRELYRQPTIRGVVAILTVRAEETP